MQTHSLISYPVPVVVCRYNRKDNSFGSRAAQSSWGHQWVLADDEHLFFEHPRNYIWPFLGANLNLTRQTHLSPHTILAIKRAASYRPWGGPLLSCANDLRLTVKAIHRMWRVRPHSESWLWSQFGTMQFIISFHLSSTKILSLCCDSNSGCLH